LAARVLEGVDTRQFTQWVVKKLGLPVNEAKLAGLTVTDLKQALTAEETQETAIETDVDMESLKLAVRYLWGEDVDTDEDLPPVEAYAEGDMPGSLRVAVASNSDENLDGHFGSALRFLIYQLSKDEIRLVAVRPTLEADLAEDKNAARSALINDCQIVYVQSVGGPAAAKIVRAGVHPMKYPQTGLAREVIARLQSILDAPPPWLASTRNERIEWSMRRICRRAAVARLAAAQDRLSTRDRADTQRIPPGGTPGYQVLTLRGGRSLGDRWTISAAVENLTDEDYRVHGSGLNEPGRNFVAGVEARF